MITNKEISEKFNINLAKIRRWAREFLPPDPKATRQSGYARELSNEEAFDILLGGYLVRALGFLVSEARDILRDLKPYLQSRGLYPGKNLRNVLKKKHHRYKVNIMSSRHMETQHANGFYLEIREQLEGPTLTDGEDIYTERYRIKWLGPEESYPDFSNIRILDITLLINMYTAVILRSDKGLVKVPLAETEGIEQVNFMKHMMAKKNE